MHLLTRYAGVRYVQVGLELRRTLVVGLVERRVGDAQVAAAPTRTLAVEVLVHVGLAAEEAVVGLDAATQRHPSVARLRYLDDLVA